MAENGWPTWAEITNLPDYKNWSPTWRQTVRNWHASGNANLMTSDSARDLLQELGYNPDKANVSGPRGVKPPGSQGSGNLIARGV